MSIYMVKGKGYRYDFTTKGVRYTKAWFKTKAEAKMAEARQREELLNPTAKIHGQALTPIAMDFLALLNRRLDFVEAYRSEKHYQTYLYHARRWLKIWDGFPAESITREEVQKFVMQRAGDSKHCANQEIRYLRATFNWAKREGLVNANPTDGIEFFPVEKRVKYVPSAEDIDRVLAVADPDTRDYLWTIRDTMGRMGEINRLTWEDIDLNSGSIILYTRKKKGGSLTPRKVPMTRRLLKIMKKRFEERDPQKPWVFWHTYWSRKEGRTVSGPYQDRKRIMQTLCQKAGVKYFRFHALRHAGASLLDQNNVPLGAIQSVLGHENRTTTEIYLHSMGRTVRDAMSVLESATESPTRTLTQNEKGALPNDITP